MLRNGVVLNGSPPSSSGSAGKNAALSNWKHMPFKEQERTPLPPPSLPLFRTQGNTETQDPFGDHLPPDRYCCVDFSDTWCVTDSTPTWVLFYLHQSHQPKKQTPTICPEYLPHTEEDIQWEDTNLPSEYSQLKFEVTYNPAPAAASSFITLLLLPCTPYNTQLLSLAPVDASGKYRQLEHKPRCFKQNLVVFLLYTTIPISLLPNPQKSRRAAAE